MQNGSFKKRNLDPEIINLTVSDLIQSKFISYFQMFYKSMIWKIMKNNKIDLKITENDFLDTKSAEVWCEFTWHFTWHFQDLIQSNLIAFFRIFLQEHDGENSKNVNQRRSQLIMKKQMTKLGPFMVTKTLISFSRTLSQTINQTQQFPPTSLIPSIFSLSLSLFALTNN